MAPWMCGSRKSVRDGSITSPAECPGAGQPIGQYLGFSPDGTMVMFWARKSENSNAGAIGIWPCRRSEVRHIRFSRVSRKPTGLPTGRVSRITRRNPAIRCSSPTRAGNPRAAGSLPRLPDVTLIFRCGRLMDRLIYFVEGSLPDQMDIWRVSADGGPAERITSQNGRLSHPVLLNRRTLVYLASDPDGSGPWLHSVDVERRRVHRLSAGADRFTSLAASADGRHLVATIAGRSARCGASARRCTGRCPGRQNPAHDQYGILSAARSRLSAVRVRQRRQPEHLEAGGGRRDGTVDGSRSADFRRSCRHGRRPAHRLLSAPARSDPPVRDAARRNERADSERISDLQGAPAWAPGGQSITSAALVGARRASSASRLTAASRPPLVDEYRHRSRMGARR